MNEKQIKTLCTALIDNYAALEAAQVALAERLATARALALDTLNGIRPEVPAGFVDLGLPSGLLWAEKQEEGYYTHEEAVKKYGEALPQPEEFVELWRVCKWGYVSGTGTKSGRDTPLPALTVIVSSWRRPAVAIEPAAALTS